MSRFLSVSGSFLGLVVCLVGCSNSGDSQREEAAPAVSTSVEDVDSARVAATDAPPVASQTSAPAKYSDPASKAGTPPTVPPSTAAGNPAPATAVEAAKVLDLREFPLPPGTIQPVERSLATLGYSVPGTVTGAYEFLQKALKARHWNEAEGSYVSEQTASGTFTQGSYKLSVAVFPGGQVDKVETVRATIINHGNLDAARLPVPASSQLLYQTPVSAAFVTEASIEEASKSVAELLQKAGWSPYGDAGETRYYKQNGVRLGARIASAPGQGNKTVIDYSTVLMSADLPLPPKAVQVQYVDVPIQLSFDLPGELSNAAQFYQEQLAKVGWKATTEQPVDMDFRKFQIYRNAAKDLIEIQFTSIDDFTRVLVKQQSAQEVADLEKRLALEMEKKKAKAGEPLPQLSLKLPADAAEVKATPRSVEFMLPVGKAQSAAEAISKQLTDDGWKASGQKFEKMFGMVTLMKESQSLTLTYVETGILPAEITLMASGVELKLP